MGYKTRKLVLFRAVTLLLVGITGIMAAEYLLRWHANRIRRSDTLDPGMIQYNPVLGWDLSPGWSGQHRHADFTARYSIDGSGFRAQPAVAMPVSPPRTLVLGDSFTFGFGVNDNQTFVHLLNTSGPGSFINAAVPGFSTDQQLLLLEERVPRQPADRILVVVYVANDLFDNLLVVPLQVGSAKPYFEVHGERLQLKNQPVPQVRPSHPRPSLMSVVLGPNASAWPLKTRLEQHSEVLRLIGDRLLNDSSVAAAFPDRFADAVRVFAALVKRMADQSSQRGLGLTVAMLARKSYVERPRSISAQYQAYFLRRVEEVCRTHRIPCVNVAEPMQARYARESERWFFPNDGHLNAEGHRVVAAILREELRRLQ